MSFSSMLFLWVFFPIVLVIGYLCRRPKIQNVFLLIASLIFYAWGDIHYFPLLIVLILANYLLGLAIEHFSDRAALSKLMLALSIIVNLGALGYYKYANFFLNTIDKLLPGVTLPRVSLALPLGISFLVFQAMTYTIDLYRGRFKAQKNVLDFALYMSFFPRMSSGPIIRYVEFGDQLSNRICASRSQFALGLRRLIYGLGKKVIIADILGVAADRIFAMDISGVNGAAAWAGAIFYTLQLYYDFSGYTDSAIGIAQMFGFKFPENFDYPYLSKSVTEFWRRWHMTLGTWFREYLYIPLGGNRKGKIRTYVNLFIVFAMTGLWHGASWNFVGWGVYNAFFIIIERMGLKKKVLDKHVVIGHIYGILTFVVGWVFFRADSIWQGFKLVKRMFCPWLYADVNSRIGTMISTQSWIACILGILGAGVLAEFFKTRSLQPVAAKWKNSIPEAVFLAAMLFVVFVLTASGSYNAFIYTRF